MPTILDIARVSGVSKSTVSRVLNHHPHVSEDSRRKVEEAIKELSYVRNLRGVQLRLQRNHTIGIVVPLLDHPYFSRLAGILTKTCRDAGYKMVIHQTFFSQDAESEIYDALIHREVDALILTHSTFSEREIKSKVQDQIVVVCNEQFDGAHFDTVGVDEEEATFIATDHLLDQGAFPLIFCGDDMDSPLQQKRWEGFKLAHAHHGLECADTCCYNKIITIEDGLALGEELFRTASPPKGIVAGSDFVAAGLLAAANAARLSVSEDVKIIGFDDLPICLTTSPTLSSISYALDEIALDLMGRLKQRLQGKNPKPLLIEQKPVLVRRGSS
ncbi:LacI family DNA-binding transcriptional regulator [Rossellomorea marisflavi]|uniref:LacI family DNA-binding transcriptional regulator n=1 Tax=Rossellomorea marisflavi TaxID=189381 RepID=UPI00296E9E53|nr:LacI family DNA-binding transcriptional regulator [Rossellomorea marisflavi]MDW4525320.1 LacI family DNA-binding transcriptional regulator [Rossellomorea marisflavi]